MTCYLDTSALVKLWSEEKGSEPVRELVRTATVLGTSVVSYAETRAAFARTLREGRWTQAEHDGAVRDLEQRWPRFMRVRVSNILAFEAGELAQRHRLRGFDAIHLASALRIRERLDVERLRFVCFDERLGEGAKAAGLEVVGES